MKCTYCLVDDILLLDGVFPSLFAISRRPGTVLPFQTENFCKLEIHELQLGGNFVISDWLMSSDVSLERTIPTSPVT